jgi:hypothetical protein
MRKDPVITRALEEQKNVRTECRAILLRLVLIFLRMNQLPLFHTPNRLVHCIVAAALKTPHHHVWFPVQVVRQLSAQQAKVVMDILHVTIMTLSIAVQRGMKLQPLVQSRVLRVATTSVIVARYVSVTLLAVKQMLISPLILFIAVQRLRRLLQLALNHVRLASIQSVPTDKCAILILLVVNVIPCTAEQAGRMQQQAVSFLALVGLHQTAPLVSFVSLPRHVMKPIHSSADRLLMRLRQHAASLARQD